MARLRQAMAIAPRSFSLLPYSSMWRWAMRPKIWPGVSSPYGRKNSSYVPLPPTCADVTELSPKRRPLRPLSER